MINQSITISNKNQYLKNKVTQIKRKAGITKIALVDTKSKMEFLSTVIIPKLSSLQSAIWQQRRDRKSLKECHIPMNKDNVWHQRECKNKQHLRGIENKPYNRTQNIEERNHNRLP